MLGSTPSLQGTGLDRQSGRVHGHGPDAKSRREREIVEGVTSVKQEQSVRKKGPWNLKYNHPPKRAKEKSLNRQSDPAEDGACKPKGQFEEFFPELRSKTQSGRYFEKEIQDVGVRSGTRRKLREVRASDGRRQRRTSARVQQR